jgi:hypothetical protein
MFWCWLWHKLMGTTPFLRSSSLSPPSHSLCLWCWLAAYLGSHSHVLESGQGLGWFYLAWNPKTKLASTLLLEAIASRTSGMVWSTFSVGPRGQDQSRKPITDHEDHTHGVKELAGLEQCWWLSNHCFQQVVVASSVCSILKSQPSHPPCASYLGSHG